MRHGDPIPAYDNRQTIDGFPGYIILAWTCLDRRQPILVLRVLPSDDVQESALDCLGDRTRVPAAHGPSVDLFDRGDLSCRAREEDLVSEVEFASSYVLFDDLISHLLRQHHDGFPGYSGKNASTDRRS